MGLVTRLHGSRKLQELGVVHVVDGVGNEVPQVVDAGVFFPRLLNGGWTLGATFPLGIAVVKNLETLPDLETSQQRQSGSSILGHITRVKQSVGIWKHYRNDKDHMVKYNWKH